MAVDFLQVTTAGHHLRTAPSPVPTGLTVFRLSVLRLFVGGGGDGTLMVEDTEETQEATDHFYTPEGEETQEDKEVWMINGREFALKRDQKGHIE